MTIRVLENLEGELFASVDDMLIWLYVLQERGGELAKVEEMLLKLKGNRS